MYFTYDDLPPELQTFLIHYQQDTPGIEPWEVLYAWWTLDDRRLEPAMDTIH